MAQLQKGHIDIITVNILNELDQNSRMPEFLHQAILKNKKGDWQVQLTALAGAENSAMIDQSVKIVFLDWNSFFDMPANKTEPKKDCKILQTIANRKRKIRDLSKQFKKILGPRFIIFSPNLDIEESIEPKRIDSLISAAKSNKCQDDLRMLSVKNIYENFREQYFSFALAWYSNYLKSTSRTAETNAIADEKFAANLLPWILPELK